MNSHQWKIGISLSLFLSFCIILILSASAAEGGAKHALHLAPTISNGSFESDSAANDINSLTGWTVESGLIDVRDGSISASDGSKYLDLSNGTIKQTVSGFVSGETYTLRIDYRGNVPGRTGGIGTLADAQVLIDGQALRQGLYGGDIPGIHSKEENDWVVCNGFEFVPTSTSVVLEIQSEESGTNGLLIDNVRFVQGGVQQPTVHDFASLTEDLDGWRQLANWSFESPISSHASDPENTGPDDENPHLCGDSIPGWRVTRENTDRIEGWVNTPHGQRVMDVGGHGPGSIAQSVGGLVPNAEYTLEFYAARHRFWDEDVADDGADPDNMVTHLWSNGALKLEVVRNFANQTAEDGYIREEVDLIANENGVITIELFSMNYLGGNNVLDAFRIIKKQVPPTVTNPGSQVSNLGESVNLQISAEDSDGDQLQFSATGLPTGLEINQNTGEITGTINSKGNHSVEVTVDDQKGNVVSATFDWTVYAPPEFSAVADQSSQEGDLVSLTISATDPDNDEFTFSSTGLPTGLSINSTSGVVSGTIAGHGVFDVTVTATDSRSSSASIDFEWQVNGKPDIDPIDKVVSELSSTVDETFAATDPEGQDLTYSATGLPSFLQLNSSTGNVTGLAQTAGTYPIELKIDDSSGGETVLNFDWIIHSSPTLEAIEDIEIGRGGLIDISILATDPDNDPIQLSTSGLPAGLSVDSNEKKIKGIVSEIGSSSIIVTAEDQHGGQATTSFVLTVVEAAQLDSIQNQAHESGDAISLQLTVVDDGGRQLAFTAENLPDGLTLNSPTGLISGVLSKGGNFQVTVQVLDANGGRHSTSFTWEVKSNTPPTGEGDTLIFLPIVLK